MEALRVSWEGREPSMPPSSPPLPFAPFLLLALFISRHVEIMLFVVAFLIFRHNDTVSSAVFTLLKSTSR
jgi:hypothetical protein